MGFLIAVAGKTYEERACCEPGSFVPSNFCPATGGPRPGKTAPASSEAEPTSDSSNTGAIVGGVVGAIAAALVLAGLLYWRRKRADGDGDRGVVERMNSLGGAAIELTDTIIPPPSAPTM